MIYIKTVSFAMRESSQKKASAIFVVIVAACTFSACEKAKEEPIIIIIINQKSYEAYCLILCRSKSEVFDSSPH